MRKSFKFSLPLLMSLFSLGQTQAQATLSSATANGLLTESSKVYNLTWYSNRSNPFEKGVTISYTGFSSGDKVTVTGSATSDTSVNQVKSNVSGFTSWLDVTGWPNISGTNNRNLCFDPGSASGTFVLYFQRLGAGGSGTFYNNIYIDVANSNCQIQTGQRITLKCTMVVDPNIYNYTSQATLSNWGDASSWSPSRSSTSSSDILVFDQGSTPLDVNVNVSNQTVKSIYIQPSSEVTFREEGSNGTITLDNGTFYTHPTSNMYTTGYDTLRFELTNGTNADINGNLTMKTPSVSGDRARLVFKGGGSVYFGGDVDIQTRNSLYISPNSSNTIYFDGPSQTLKGAGDLYINGLSNVTVGTGSSSSLSLQRPLPILGVLTLLTSGGISSTSTPASTSAADWNAWVPNLQIKNNGTYRGRIATLPSGATISGGSYFEMWSNGIRTYRTIAFPFENPMHLSQITDDLIISGVFSGSNQDSMDRSCGYCKASSYQWSETNSRWDSVNSSSTPTKIDPGKGLLLFFRGLVANGLGNPSAAANAGNIDYKGKLFFGSKTVNLAYNGTGSLKGYNLIGNPYPCHIDFRSLTRNNVDDKFQIYDPTTKSYNVWNNTTGSVQKTGTSKFTSGSNAHIIEIGASFFAIANNSSASITFDEADKTTTGPDATAFRMLDSGLKCNQVRGNIQYVSDTIEFADQFFLEWNANYSNVSSEVDKYDVSKFFGGYLGIGTKTSTNEWLTMDYRPSTGESKQTFPLEVRTMTRDAYKITMTSCLSNTEYTINLLDKETNTLTEIGAEASYVFNTSDNDKFDADRFDVVIESKVNSVKSTKTNTWVVYPNPNKSGIVNIATTSTEKINSIEVVDIHGKVVQAINKPSANNFELLTSIANGTYFVRIISDNAVVSNSIIINR